MHLDVESLRAFLAVLEHGSMTGAAKALHLTQSAVSWKMKRLETKVGQPLLLREGRRLTASHAGRSIIDDARRAVEAHDAVVARLRSAELTGRVRLGAVEDVGVERLTGILGSFRRIHPAVELSFVIAPSVELDQRLRSGDLDLVLVQVLDESVRPGDRIVGHEQITWATSVEWPNDGDPVSVIAYSDTCFYREMGTRQLLTAGIDHRIRFTIPHNEGVRSAVAAGLGVSVLGRHHLGDEIVEWPRAAELPAFPEVRHVLRGSATEASPVVAALAEVITWEFDDTASAAATVTDLDDRRSAEGA